MIRVLVADDEAMLREGLKCIIDWQGLGFTIIDEAKNGEDALNKILLLQPDLVLLDIRMPKLYGTDIIKLSREQGYKGHFIILSGHSDFQYAQTAIRYGVDFYLTKPIDEDELENAVKDVKDIIWQDQNRETTLIQYKTKAKTEIIKEILTGAGSVMALNLEELHYTASVYQVVIYERYMQDDFPAWYDFANLLRVTNQDNSSFDSLKIDEQNIIILKGSFALQRFQDLLAHYQKDVQKGSPLDSIFLTYGPVVYKIEQIQYSYAVAKELLSRRFFCEKNQHVLSYMELPDPSSYTYSIQSPQVQDCQEKLLDYLLVQNRNMLAQTIHELEHILFYAKESITDIKHFLADVYLQIKQEISYKYRNADIPLPTNSFIIQFVESKYFLFEILLFFSEQFDIIINAVGNPGGEHVMQDILNYIDLNYYENLKLEKIAHLFGYNSSYLGKVFHKKIGLSFNSYIDQVRIEHSKELLRDPAIKVYEVSSRVGYKNVDYFHKKFKKYINQSPAEYRRSLNEFADET